jgi:hypothetical protein
MSGPSDALYSPHTSHTFWQPTNSSRRRQTCDRRSVQGGLTVNKGSFALPQTIASSLAESTPPRGQQNPLLRRTKTSPSGTRTHPALPDMCGPIDHSPPARNRRGAGSIVSVHMGRSRVVRMVSGPNMRGRYGKPFQDRRRGRRVSLVVDY